MAFILYGILLCMWELELVFSLVRVCHKREARYVFFPQLSQLARKITQIKVFQAMQIDG